MAQNLVIVESPAKAKTIGRFLGKGYKIEASIGHVRDLPKSQMGVDIENDFKPRYINIRGKAEIINRLKKEAKNAKKVYLATDPDREGEAISWHLANLLNIDNAEKCRITFNEITQNAIKNAIKSPREIDMNLVNAQQARRVLDRIVGYKISPLLWRKIKKGLSAGRVQSVATRLICDREDEINRFVPEEFWTITAKLSKKQFKSTFEARIYAKREGKKEEKIDLKTEEQVNAILKELAGSDFVVEKVKKTEKKKAPSPPFTTSTLQQEASRRLGFPTKKTMLIAQQLYEGIEVKGVGAVGLVTYIRTDSLRISAEAQKDAKEFIGSKYGNMYLPEELRIFKNKSESQDAHEAIRPTHVAMEPDAIKTSLTNDQYKLYKLIWERFVASQMASAIYDTVNVDIKAGDYLFKASGSKIKFDGYLTVYADNNEDEASDDEDRKSNIPDIEEGELLEVRQIDPKQHFTQPPPRYTEATLVKALEEKGIGRPSTYAPIITTIIQRGYVVLVKKFLVPTELGKIVTELLKTYFKDIVDVTFTAQLEKKLDDIEEGQKNWVEIMQEFYSQFVPVLKEADVKIGHVDVPDEISDVVCEKCGKNMVIKNGRFGRFLACPGFPQCKNTKPLFEEAGVVCPDCGGKVVVKKSKKGKKYYGCENYPECKFMTWNKPLEEKCPKCGGVLVRGFVGRKPQVKCSNEDCDYVSSNSHVNNSSNKDQVKDKEA